MFDVSGDPHGQGRGMREAERFWPDRVWSIAPRMNDYFVQLLL